MIYSRAFQVFSERCSPTVDGGDFVLRPSHEARTTQRLRTTRRSLVLVPWDAPRVLPSSGRLFTLRTGNVGGWRWCGQLLGGNCGSVAQSARVRATCGGNRTARRTVHVSAFQPVQEVELVMVWSLDEKLAHLEFTSTSLPPWLQTRTSCSAQRLYSRCWDFMLVILTGYC